MVYYHIGHSLTYWDTREAASPMSQTQTLIRALAVLDCFDVDHPLLGVRDIARQLHMSHSTVGRLLATMRSAGVLSQDPVTRCYMIGPKVLTWSAIYTSGLDIRNRARPALEELHRATSETISLYILDGDERICVDRIESQENLRMTTRVGERLPIHIEASGKIFLAFVPPVLREQVISRVYKKSSASGKLSSRETLLDDLKKIQAQGYAVSHGESTVGASCVSAPVFDATGKPIAAITVSGPTIRMTDDKISEYASLVIVVARQVSQAMGLNGFPQSPNRDE
jgi:IclR family KDG regulon transcriptional repressor